MNGTDQRSAWAAGDAYEPYVGRWSRPVARQFLRWLDMPAGLRWLDVGCGTGALSETILEAASPASVQGADLSANYVEYARARITDPRAGFGVCDAASLSYVNNAFDVAVSGLALNFVPDPSAAASEMARVTRGGGTVAVYVWDYAGGMQLMRHFWDAAAELDPSAAALDEGRRFPICQPEPLVRLFREAGLTSVESRAIDVPTVFESFDDYWSPFLGGQGPAPGYAMSLGEDRRAELRELLRSRLPVSDGGRIKLTASAWAVKGVT
jgi:SAM-dependent methyltransferase